MGCLLGMFPLLFFNDKKCEEKEEEESPKAADEKGEKLTKKESEARPVLSVDFMLKRFYFEHCKKCITVEVDKDWVVCQVALDLKSKPKTNIY